MPLSLLLGLGSACLLILSFPSWDCGWCAWVALAPWLWALGRLRSWRAAFGWSYVVGVLFWLGSIQWLIHVTLVGWLIFPFYLALFFGLFGVLARRIALSTRSPLLTALGTAAAWVLCEWLRGAIWTGFPWNLLAHTQWRALPVIQLADVTGAWGVSFLIVLVNIAIVYALRRLAGLITAAAALTALAAALAALLLSVGYGLWRVQHIATGASVRIATVQGNIPQTQKWDPAFARQIVQTYDRLNRAAAATQPALIVWPETSLPVYLEDDPTVEAWLTGMVRETGAPILLGRARYTAGAAGDHFYNSATLMTAAGIAANYDKIRLVPYGEYVPLSEWTPRWGKLAEVGDFSRGHHDTVFDLPATSDQRPATGFATLICFEDIFPWLARRMTAAGAQALVVITNDAWFGKSGAQFQHAQASIFRAVENRVPVIRSANTGWSGLIDATGKVVEQVQDANGETRNVTGWRTATVQLGAERTLYARFGDWFVVLCLLLVVASLTLRRTGTIMARGLPSHGS